MSDQPGVPSKQRTWAERLTWWGAVLSIPLFIVSTALALYTWVQSEVEIDPTLIVDPQRTVLIERNRVKDAPVQVVRRDGTPVERDVTGVRVYFWNDGRKPTQRAEILEPFRLVVKEPAEILDFRIVKSSRPKITELAVKRVEKTNNQLSLEYRVLERGEGLALQLVIAGDPEAPIRMEGAARGAPGVTTAESAAPKHPWYWAVTSAFKWILTAALISYFVFSARNLVQEWRTAATNPRERKAFSSDIIESFIPVMRGIIIGGMLVVIFSATPNYKRHDREWYLDLVPDALLDKPSSKH